MKQDAQKVIEECQKLCSESWKAIRHARRVVEEIQAVSDDIRTNILLQKKQRKLKATKEKYSLAILFLTHIGNFPDSSSLLKVYIRRKLYFAKFR